MIKVGIVTTLAPEACGHRVYAEELMQSVTDPDIEFKHIGRPFNFNSVVERIKDCDVVHWNHSWQLHSDLKPEHIQHFKSMGKKTVCTWHESHTENRSALTVAFDAVVVHQKTVDGFIHIPVGIWDMPLPQQPITDFIGVVGFPFDYKNYPVAARVARTCGARLLAFLPEAVHGDVRKVVGEIQRYCPNASIRTDFVPQAEIIQAFSQCLFTMFPYSHTGSGIGGSVRLGIAARRPVVISNVVRFGDLLEDYKDEFYVIPDAYPTYESTMPVIDVLRNDIATGTARVPNRVIADQSLQRTASMYTQLYKSLLNR